MQVRTILLLAAALAPACSSGVAPGSESVTDQIDRALVVQVDATLTQAAVAQQAVKGTTGSYAADVAALRSSGLNIAAEVTLNVTRADTSSFCIEATHTRSAGVRHIKETGTPADGVCD